MPKSDSDLDDRSTERVRGTQKSITETVKTTRPMVAGPNGKTINVAQGDGLMSQTLMAQRQLEYVASGSYLWLNHYLRSLPWYIDDLTSAFGDDLYERMLKDPKVRGSFEILKASIIVDGIQLLPAEDMRDWNTETPSLPGSKRPRQSSPLSREICAFCQWALDHMGRAIDDLVFEMLDAAAYGNKIAEKIYTDPLGGGKLTNGRVAIKKIKTKPRKSTAFVVDAYANVVGILGLIPGQGYPIIVQGLMGPPGSIPNMLPRSKFCVLAWKPTNEDPRGTSHLYSAYTPWWVKQQFIGERLKFGARFGSPSLFGTAAENAMLVQATGPDGTPMVDTAGSPVMISPVTNIYNALVTYQNGTVMAAPHGTEVTMMEPKSTGEFFKQSIDDCNLEIDRAILYQTMASGEPQSGNLGSGGTSESHQDIMGLPIKYGKLRVAHMIAWDICMDLIRANWGDEAMELCPTVSLGDVESHNFAEMGKTLASLGYTVDPSQYEGIDADLGLPARAADWQKKAEEAAQGQESAGKSGNSSQGSDDEGWGND